jgi:hypothetical protein
MTNAKNWTIEDLFLGKPENIKLFRRLQQHIESLGQTEMVVAKTQVSFGAKRKFAWLWLAPVTKKAPEGILMLTLDMTHKIRNPLIRTVEEFYPGKWTHQIAITDMSVIEAIFRHKWVEEAYKFGTMVRA